MVLRVEGSRSSTRYLCCKNVSHQVDCWPNTFSMLTGLHLVWQLRR
ncbi:hypothetical protein HanPSC8_Chr11g0495771 [Helianthus annuus]|nr:hypothetical protein HanPSC8_Chr11g0495771 [Helianthus annuus]